MQIPYWLENLLQDPHFLGGAYAVGGILVLYILFKITFRPPRTIEAFTSEGGRVLVSRRAVRELIQRCSEDLGEVGSADVKVDIKRGRLHTRVELRLRRNANLKGISGYLREQVTLALTENLGVEELGEVDIVVIGVLNEAATSP